MEPSGSRFQTQIRINGTLRHFGTYDTGQEAAFVFDVVARRFPSIGVRRRTFNFSDPMLQELAVSHPQKKREIEVMQALLPTPEQQQQQMPMPISTGPMLQQPSVATQPPAAQEHMMQLLALLMRRHN